MFFQPPFVAFHLPVVRRKSPSICSSFIGIPVAGFLYIYIYIYTYNMQCPRKQAMQPPIAVNQPSFINYIPVWSKSVYLMLKSPINPTGSRNERGTFRNLSGIPSFHRAISCHSLSHRPIIVGIQLIETSNGQVQLPALKSGRSESGLVLEDFVYRPKYIWHWVKTLYPW